MLACFFLNDEKPIDFFKSIFPRPKTSRSGEIMSETLKLAIKRIDLFTVARLFYLSNLKIEDYFGDQQRRPHMARNDARQHNLSKFLDNERIVYDGLIERIRLPIRKSLSLRTDLVKEIELEFDNLEKSSKMFTRALVYTTINECLVVDEDIEEFRSVCVILKNYFIGFEIIYALADFANVELAKPG